MTDITYCISECPFDDCRRHKSKIEIAANEGRKYVRIADHAPVCRRYIASVVDEVQRRWEKTQEG